MEHKHLIKDTIIEKYGSINAFTERRFQDLPFSRVHLYQLANYKVENPGVKTLESLAKILELSKEDVINDYLAGYRDEQPNG